jgi:ubiquitin carboxyl-terminal hydrolase 4/11/15
LFKNGDFKAKINGGNVLDSGGQLVEAFGDLVKQMWEPNTETVSPSKFKSQLDQCLPQFSDYAQHDSHELLSCLLNKLHEGLNEVKSKPYYTDDIDTAGNSNVAVAKEAMVYDTFQNTSPIQRYFTGQFKCTVECTACLKKSATFDPFMSVSVPRPSPGREAGVSLTACLKVRAFSRAGVRAGGCSPFRARIYTCHA